MTRHLSNSIGYITVTGAPASSCFDALISTTKALRQ